MKKITNQQIIKYTEQESKFQSSVYRRKVREGNMTQEESDTNQAIIKRLGAMARAMEARQMDWDDLAKIFSNIPIKVGQKELF